MDKFINAEDEHAIERWSVGDYLKPKCRWEIERETQENEFFEVLDFEDKDNNEDSEISEDID